MQSVLDKEREFEQESNRIQGQKQALEMQIRNLQLGAGEADPRLARIAEQVGACCSRTSMTTSPSMMPLTTPRSTARLAAPWWCSTSKAPSSG